MDDPLIPSDDDATSDPIKYSMKLGKSLNPNTTKPTSYESMFMMELTELEMMKKRDCEAEKQRSEVEDEMTRMMLQTHLQIASFVFPNRPNRKRKQSKRTDTANSSERYIGQSLNL